MFWIFVDPAQLASGQARITGPAGHHLARVLRVRPGEVGTAVAEGREYRIEVTEARAGEVLGRVLEERPVSSEPAVHVILLQAVLPNPDFDAVIEAATAVGVGRFVAVQAARSVARPSADRLPRWQQIAQSAAEQSHRGRVPKVIGPLPLHAAISREIERARLLALDPAAPLSLADALDGSTAYALAVGPEGGWTAEESTLMRDAGGVAANLGPRILRARLAPVVGAAILVQRS